MSNKEDLNLAKKRLANSMSRLEQTVTKAKGFILDNNVNCDNLKLENKALVIERDNLKRKISDITKDYEGLKMLNDGVAEDLQDSILDLRKIINKKLEDQNA